MSSYSSIQRSSIYEVVKNSKEKFFSRFWWDKKKMSRWMGHWERRDNDWAWTFFGERRNCAQNQSYEGPLHCFTPDCFVWDKKIGEKRPLCSIFIQTISLVPPWSVYIHYHHFYAAPVSSICHRIRNVIFTFPRFLRPSVKREAIYRGGWPQSWQWKRMRYVDAPNIGRTFFSECWSAKYSLEPSLQMAAKYRLEASSQTGEGVFGPTILIIGPLPGTV